MGKPGPRNGRHADVSRELTSHETELRDSWCERRRAPTFHRSWTCRRLCFAEVRGCRQPLHVSDALASFEEGRCPTHEAISFPPAGRWQASEQCSTWSCFSCCIFVNCREDANSRQMSSMQLAFVDECGCRVSPESMPHCSSAKDCSTHYLLKSVPSSGWLCVTMAVFWLLSWQFGT